MGVDIPGKKHIRFALRYIHGIGPKRADDVLAAVNVDPMKKADDVTQDEIHAITTFIQDHYRVEGDLRREVSQNIRRLAHEDERSHPQGRQARVDRDAQAGRPVRG